MKPRLVIGLTLVLGLGVGSLGLRCVRHRPGGLEEVIGDALSDLRMALPVLVEPISRWEDHLHESYYRLSVRLRGRSAGLVRAGGRIVSGERATPRIERARTPSPSEQTTTVHPDTMPPSVWNPNASANDSTSPGSDSPIWTPVSSGTSYWLRESRLVTNPAFPDAPSLLLRVDLKRARIRWQPGTRNPWRMTPQHRRLADASPPPDRSGRVPDDALADTLIAFGGGFESIHFYNYGAIHRGQLLVPLEVGIQTLVIYDDGSVRLGPWGSPALPKESIVEARQNLPPLVHQGRVPADIVWLNAGTLNATYTLDAGRHRLYSDVHTWRSGLGLTAEGDLVYCFGSRLDPRMLAEALIRAGAVEAMMLDVNAGYHCTPSLIVPSGDGRSQVLGLYPGINAGQRFLSGSPKDFFYVRPNGRHDQHV
jgi:hypothetical protein